MREINDTHDAENQRQANSQECVSATQDQRIDKMLKKFVHARPVCSWLRSEEPPCCGDSVPQLDVEPPGRYISGGPIPDQTFGMMTLPFSILIRYTVGMLWPLSLPSGPDLMNLIFPFNPVMSSCQNAARMASGSALPAFWMAAAIVRMPS